MELSEQEVIRRHSLEELRGLGINPYPAAEFVTNGTERTRDYPPAEHGGIAEDRH